MAASAYAGLLSLLNTMDQIKIHTRLSTCFDESQFESLCKVVDFLVDFVVNYSDADSEEAQNFVRSIAAAAHEAEDVIQVQAADLLHVTGETPTLLNLHRNIQDMISIKDKVINVKEDYGLTNSMAPPSPDITLVAEYSQSLEWEALVRPLLLKMCTRIKLWYIILMFVLG